MNHEPTSTAWRSFRFRRQIGSGGFGEVYQAEMVTAGGFAKIVAVKLLRPDFQDDPDVVSRLRDEARLLGQLRHPAIVQADDLIFLASRLAVIMEYVPGVNLLTLIDPRHNPDPIPPPVTLAIIRRVAEALDAAWSRPGTISGQPLRVMHRDIKPSNIRITPDGEVKVLDFGVARSDALDRDTTTQDQLIGSLPYLAPEGFLRQPMGHHSDVYALGVVFYEALARARFGRCGLRRGEHTALVAERFSRLDLSHWGDAAPQARDLLRRMLHFHVTERPSCHEVAECCRELDTHFSGPSLDIWARVVVERLANSVATDGQGSLSGQTLAEDTRSRPIPHPMGLEFEDHPTEPQRSAPRPSAPPVAPPTGRRRGGLPWLAIGGSAVLLVVVGLLLLWVLAPWSPSPARPQPEGEATLRQASAPADIGVQPTSAPATPDPTTARSEAITAPPPSAEATRVPQPPTPSAQPGTASDTPVPSRTATTATITTSQPGGTNPPGAEASPGATTTTTTDTTTTGTTTGTTTTGTTTTGTATVDAAFSSRPLGVAITVDGVYRGTTPVRVPLTAGAHRVIFQDGEQIHREEIQVRSDHQNLWTYHVGEDTIR